MSSFSAAASGPTRPRLLPASANVAILDINLTDSVTTMPPRNVTTLFSDRHNILDCLQPPTVDRKPSRFPRVPYLVRRDDLKRMQHRRVIIDVAIDQGGRVETARPTTQ